MPLCGFGFCDFPGGQNAEQELDDDVVAVPSKSPERSRCGAGTSEERVETASVSGYTC